MRIGVLALQGGFASHMRVLREIGHQPIEVRDRHALAKVDGLILPGGESTTQLKLLARAELQEDLRALVRAGAPVLATCAGLILIAANATQPAQESFALLDVDVARNAWGRQIDSFEAIGQAAPGCPELAQLPLLFIRAPRILRVGSDVQVLVRFQDEAILVRSNHILGATFHPELTADHRVHRLAFPS